MKFTFINALSASALMLLAAVAGACSDDEGASPGSDAAALDAGADAAAPADAASGSDGAADAVTDAAGDGASDAGADAADPGVVATLIRVCAPDSCQHYLFFLAGLPADGKLDRGKAVESGETQGAIYNGAVYIFDRSARTIQRWTADAELKPVPGAMVSLQGTGIQYVGSVTNAFVSPTRAFLQDSDSGLIVTWNPTTMEVVATTPIAKEQITRDGLPLYGGWPAVASGRVYYPMYAYDYQNHKGYGKVVVGHFDAAADQPTMEFIEDDRCGVSLAVAPRVDAAGDVYVVGEWGSGFAQVGVNPPAPNPACLLRIKAGQKVFDPGYRVDLLAAGQARALQAGFWMTGNKLLANLWPNSSPAPTAEELAANPDAFWGFKKLQYSIIDLDQQTATPVLAIPPGGGGNLTPLTLDGANYVQIYPQGQLNADGGADLYEVRADGAIRKVLSAGTKGDFEMIGRLR